jgi:hypothetical protein
MIKVLDNGVERNATPEEIAEIQKRQSASDLQNRAARKTAILAELASIDLKSIRALREGNQQRIAELESQAVALRAELAVL